MPQPQASNSRNKIADFSPTSHMQLLAQTQHKQQNSNRHNKIIEFTYNAIQSHNPKTATATTKSQIFPTHLTLLAQIQHKQNSNRCNKIMEFTHNAIQSHTPKANNSCNKIVDFSHTSHTCNYQPKHNTNNKMATATAATKSWNTYDGHTQKMLHTPAQT